MFDLLVLVLLVLIDYLCVDSQAEWFVDVCQPPFGSADPASLPTPPTFCYLARYLQLSNHYAKSQLQYHYNNYYYHLTVISVLLFTISSWYTFCNKQSLCHPYP